LRAASGVSINNLTKVLKCAHSDDSITMRAEDDSDNVQLMFESPGAQQHATQTAMLVFWIVRCA
jgi:hypothetical protein